MSTDNMPYSTYSGQVRFYGQIQEVLMFKENSPSYHIMTLICMCGECSEKALSILIPHDGNRNKLITSLVTKKLITRYQKKDLLGFRLTGKSKKMILQTEPERFGFFLENGADYSMRRASISYRIRQHRISETLAMMERAGIEIYRNNKNNIFEIDLEQTEKIVSSAFYLSKEVKTQQSLTQKIINSKMTGLWLTEDEPWLCYLSNKESFWPFNNIEHRTDTLIRSKLRTTDQTINYCNIILFGNTIEQAKIYLNNNLVQDYIQKSPFQRFCYIPLDENGIMLLKFLNNKNLYKQLLTVLSEDLQKNKNSYIIQDGFNPEGLPVLICIDCDLKRLLFFRNQLCYSGKYGQIICFDFQESSLKEFCGENISIAIVDSGKVKSIFFFK